MGEGEGFIGPSQRAEIEKGRDREKQRKKKARDLRMEREIKKIEIGRKERQSMRVNKYKKGEWMS